MEIVILSVAGASDQTLQNISKLLSASDLDKKTQIMVTNYKIESITKDDLVHLHKHLTTVLQEVMKDRNKK